MKICRNCGYQNQDSNNFCQGCGQRLDQQGGTDTQPYGVQEKKKGHIGIWIIAILLALVIVVGMLVLLFGRGMSRSGQGEDGGQTEAEAGEGEDTLSADEGEDTLPADDGESEDTGAGDDGTDSGEDPDSSGDSAETQVASIDYASPIPVNCSVTASSTMGSAYSADNLQDRNLATAWAEGIAGSGIGEYLTYRPQGGENTLVYGIAVAPGLQTNQEIYKSYSYPVLLHIRGEGIDETVNLNFYLADFEYIDNSLRFFSFSSPIAAEELTITIDEVQYGERYPDSTCIAELWLYTCQPYGVASGDYWSMGGGGSYVNADAQYIIADSSERYLTDFDLMGFTQQEARLARNEIYARHGYIFDDEYLRGYFENCSWYVGRIPSDEFSDELLNDYEKQNVQLILDFENKLKNR